MFKSRYVRAGLLVSLSVGFITLAVGQVSNIGERVAAEVKAGDGNEWIRLYNSKGECRGEAMKAEYIYKDKSKVLGCWKPLPGGRIQIVFMDGDIAIVPITAFKEPEEV